jgi:A/G-specific adenine glycosylase
MSSFNFEDLSNRLLNWYKKHGRCLPWRGLQDPYAIWVSEIMLQQTRVETVIPYFEHWMDVLPTVTALAQASEEEVLRLWEGLGYYSRARNLQKAARQVQEEYGGSIPHQRQALEALPGIGRYTAGAIASIAFGEDEPVLDGNVRRVLARLFDIDLPARSTEADKLFWKIAEHWLPPGKAGDFNQAVMDLGATVCTPRTPDCSRCPLASLCRAYQEGTQEDRPVLKSRPAVPHYTVTAAVIVENGRILLARRPPNGLLGGMWEFPGGKQEQGETLPACLQREIKEELGIQIQVGDAFGIYEHAYTHFRVTLHAFLCQILNGIPQALEASEIRWVYPHQLKDFPMGKIDRQIALRLQI